MTDTGKLPEGHQPGPDDAAGGHRPAAAPDDLPGAAAPAETAPAAEGTADDDDFLFLPGAQGAWTDPRVPASAGARSAPPAGGAEPATGAQRRPLHMGPPVPEQAGGVVRSLADRGPASGSVDTREAVAAADAATAAGGAPVTDGAAQAGNAGGRGAGSPAPATAAGPQAAGQSAPAPDVAAGPEHTAGGAAGPGSAAAPEQAEGSAAAGADTAPGSAQSAPAAAGAVAGAVPDQGAPGPAGGGREATAAGGQAAGRAPEPGRNAPGGLAPGQGTAAPGEPVPTAAGSVPPQVAGAGGPAPQPPVRTPGPPTVGPEYLDVTRAGTPRLPGPQLGEIPPAPAGWTGVSHPADGDTAAQAGADPAAVPEAAPEGDGATAPAPANAAQGTAGGTGPGPDGGPAQPAHAADAAADQNAVGAPAAAPVDAAQAAVRRAAASAGASLGRGISAHGGATAAPDGRNGAAGPQPADEAAAAAHTQPTPPAPGGQTGAAAAAVPGAVTGGPENPAGGRPPGADAAERPAPHAVRDGRLAAAAAVSGVADGSAGEQVPGAGPAYGAAPHTAAPHPAPPHAAGQPGNAAAAVPAAAPPSGPEGSAQDRAPAGDPADGAASHAVPGEQSGGNSPELDGGRDGSATGAGSADGTVLRAVPGDGTAVPPAGNGEAPAGEQVPGDRTAAAEPAAAQADGQTGGDSPAQVGRQGEPAGPNGDAAVLHAVTSGQTVNGAKARAANGQAVSGGQPAVPAARAASDEAAPAGAVHAASGGRRGVSLGVKNGAHAAPSGTAGEAAADPAAEAQPAADSAPRAAAGVTQIRGRRRRGSAVSATVTAATPAGDAQAQDAAASGASVPAQSSPAPRPAPADEPTAVPAPAAGTPADGAAAPGPAAPDGDRDAPDAAPGFADAERAAVHRVMRERRDIRNGFRSDPVPHEVLLRVLEAAHTAPSVGHSQPWDFVVIRSEETRHRMRELARRQREAYAKSLPKGRAKQFKELKVEAIRDTPVNIVVTADPTRGGRHTLGRHTQPQMAPYSSALAVENLWLAARAEGLGVGWVSFFDERELVRELDLPEHLDVVAYLCLGYVDEFPEEPELVQAGWSKRRPLSWVVHEESYGRRALPGEDPHDLLAETLEGIRPLDAKALGEAWERQKRMTKPAGSLGMLEIISAQLCGLSRKCPPPVPEPAAVAVFAGDHGVHAQGVTPWPQEVTGQMVANFLGGGAVCNAFAAQVGAEVCVVDVGVAAELPATAGLVPRKVRKGTADITAGPAMTREEVLRAVEVGIETARDLVAAGNKALLTGEMGIANTTASAALIAVFTDSEAAEVTGRGTGVDDETYARKVEAVRRAIEVNHPDPSDPVGVLAAVGGLEHAALVGFILAGSSLRTPVVLDGVSAGAAALVARAVAPESLAACIAGHRSPEPGHTAALTKLGLRPLIDLDLRLGEGTGALLALPLVQSAARAMHEVATFDAAGVTEKG